MIAFEQLFNYDLHANTGILENLRKIDATMAATPLRLMSHIVNAQHIWLHRIAGKMPQYEVWRNHSLDECLDLLQMNFENTVELLATTDFERKIDYVNSSGGAFCNSVGDILFHIINHGTYHRAQIATQMRHLGLEPLATDYIFYKRTMPED